MRSLAPIAVALATFLLAGSARAQTYRVLLGSSDVFGPLSGSFEVGELRLGDPRRNVLLIDDFAFQLGRHPFSTALSPEFEGLRPLLFPLIPDQISLQAKEVESVRLRADGAIEAVFEEEVVFRYLDFRNWSFWNPDDPVPGGRAVGLLEDGITPRRLHLEGGVFVVAEGFEIRREPCDPPLLPAPLPPPGDGGGVGDGGAVIIASDPVASFESFDLDAEETARFVGPRSRDAALSRVTGAGSAIGGELVEIGGTFVPIPIPFCPGLWPIHPREEHQAGFFRLVATAARPLAIDVDPRGRGGLVDPGAARPLDVAVLGSDDLDVRDLDERSLRLGDGEAPARGRPRRTDVDGDGRLDLLARFAPREAGIAYGDEVLCLLGETREGSLFEGCDAIETAPAR